MRLRNQPRHAISIYCFSLKLSFLSLFLESFLFSIIMNNRMSTCDAASGSNDNGQNRGLRINTVDGTQRQLPFNICVLRDTRVPGWGNDFREIIRIFSSYRHQFITMDDWTGFFLHSSEFVRGILYGHRPPTRSIGTQTLETSVNDDFVQIRSPK